MPTYEYECDACGATFERSQSITAKPVRRCPECRKAKVRRLISAGAGFLFRGSGFYQTDYRSEEYKSKAKAESAPASAASAKDSSSKSESGKGAGSTQGSKAEK